MKFQEIQEFQDKWDPCRKNHVVISVRSKPIPISGLVTNSTTLGFHMIIDISSCNFLLHNYTETMQSLSHYKLFIKPVAQKTKNKKA